MLKSGGAAIPMQANFNRIISQPEVHYTIGNPELIANMPNSYPMKPFSDNVIAFFNELSKALLNIGKAYSDVVTFAFWCRKAALITEKNKYSDLDGRIGRGIVFHSTPSNVPVNFAFSFAAGFLAGNANIVRLPAKSFEQVDIICAVIKNLLEERFFELKPYVVMLKYGMLQDVNDCLSSLCDTRVVWGGDNTIMTMRRSPLKPRANEITFADRHSLAIINANVYTQDSNKQRIIQDFYNDTYFSDQNACTSPRVVLWFSTDGDLNRVKTAQNDFWERLHLFVKKRYSLAPVQSVGKLSTLYQVASKYNVSVEEMPDNYVTRVKIDQVDTSLMQYKYHSGFFYEKILYDWKDLIPLCGEACQTLSFYGFDATFLRDVVLKLAPRGIDRIVPIGKTMDFSLIWDGHDLIREMSREIII